MPMMSSPRRRTRYARPAAVSSVTRSGSGNVTVARSPARGAARRSMRSGAHRPGSPPCAVRLECSTRTCAYPAQSGTRIRNSARSARTWRSTRPSCGRWGVQPYAVYLAIPSSVPRRVWKWPLRWASAALNEPSSPNTPLYSLIRRTNQPHGSNACVLPVS
ncbi:hypothetical protein ACFYWS_00695 [Streptomyces sp. NPDC002795]|uniref:hypothetical protein n=1 Tax=Streptomyces sp. NPDC002795 TaxID=3364665 RepID=UPI00368C94B1